MCSLATRSSRALAKPAFPSFLDVLCVVQYLIELLKDSPFYYLP